MTKVFNIGFSKTGTTSMEDALEILGYNVCRGYYNNNLTNYLVALYVNKDFEEILKLTRYFDAFADGPWGGTDLYKTLYKNYPNAKYILTTRDSEQWYNSFVKMFMKFTNDIDKAFETFHKAGRYGTTYFFSSIFNIKTLKGNKQQIIKIYENRNKEIIDFFKDKPNFLKIDITQNSEWTEICKFLEKESPDKPFPHSNVGVSKETLLLESKPSSVKNKIKNKLISIIKKI